MKTQIIFEDKDTLVVRKPAGIAVESARPGQQDVVSELKNYLVAKTGERNPYLGVIHRIDQPVEGLLIFAKNRMAADYFSGKLQKGDLDKEYQAVVWGVMPQKEGTLINYLVKENAMARITDSPKERNAGKAILHYRVLKECEVERDVDSVSSDGTGDQKTFVSLLQIVIETGRFHQIRAQLAFAGHPILGDLKYGTEETIEFSHSHGIKHVALCAAKLVVPFQSGEKAYTVEPQNTAFRIC